MSRLSAAAAHRRRILHQPFFPQDSFPPSQPPIPSPPAPPTSKRPFSTSTPNNTPFFQSYPSPPPPPSPASFTANITSLNFSHSKSNSTSTKLIIAAVAAVIVAVAILALAIFMHFRNRKRTERSRESDRSKSQRSDSTVAAPPAAFHGGPDNSHIPKLSRPSQSSSEFLYLGTLVNSHAAAAGGFSHKRSRSSTLDNRTPNVKKTSSPELRPLPPLSAQQFFRRSYRSNADVASSRGDEDEEFFSPKGSLYGAESSIAAGSASRRTFAAIDVENFNGSTSNSSSTSNSPARSISLSLSPGNSLSPRNSIPKSPDLFEIRNFAPLNRQTTSSPPPRHSVRRESPSPSPPSSSSPERYSRRSEESSPRISIFSDQNTESPARITVPPNHDAMAIPKPPDAPFSAPPPPPPLPISPTPPANIPLLQPMTTGTPSLVSPIELPKTVSGEQKEEISPKTKLKPLHWDKVRASSGREMVWDQLKCSSFKLNEEMIESLFIANASKPSPKEATSERVLDPKKAQNVAILLRAFDVTVEEVCEGLMEGNTDVLGTELLESLLKMAPSKEEERKLKEFKHVSPTKLGAAERFLMALLDIPHTFRRVDAMLYISNFENEVEYLQNSFATLEAACEELRSSRMFLKLLEAVLKTGNRMNVGTNKGDAHAFKLDTLLKLVHVKGADGKTTLLHFVVQEVIRSEGARLSPTDDDAKCRKVGLQVVSGLSDELSNVKRAAAMDAEALSSEVSKLSKGIRNIAEVAKLVDEKSSDNSSRNKFCDSVKRFMEKAEEEIIRIQAQESAALSLVKEITEYFHGSSVKEEAHPFRIFLVVWDFLTVLDRVCKEVGVMNERSTISTAHKFPVLVNPLLQQVAGGFPDRRRRSSSDEESS